MRFVFQTYVKPKKNSGILDGRGRKPRFIANPGGKASERAIRQEAWDQCLEHRYRMVDGPVRLVAVFRKTPADCVGLLETVLDALQGVVYANDRQVVDFAARWDMEGFLEKHETCIVNVEPYVPTPTAKP